VITSTKNPAVAEAAKLKKRGLREQAGRFLVEGAQATGEALDAGAVEAVFHVPGSGGRVPEVVAAAERAGVPVTAVSEAVMSRLTSAVTPQGLVAVARFVDAPLDRLPAGGTVPVLCSVRDPGNAGAVLRSADAAGASAVVFTESSVDVYNAKTVRASAGSLFHLPVVREADPETTVEALRDRGFRILAAAPEAEASMYDLDLSPPTAILFGNEAWGLPPEIRDLADGAVRVPIQGGAESLNLAAAAALLLFEAARQRNAGGAGYLPALISAAVHDLRLPLTALKGFAATLVDQWGRFEDAERRHLVEGMLLDVERVAAMVSLVVEAARLEGGGLQRVAGPYQVADSLRWVAAIFDRSREYPDVKVSGQAQVAVDRERLQTLLLVLCEGAMWWGREGPIEIEAREEPGSVVIEVGRKGGGPDPGEVESMFAGPGAPGIKVGLHVARRLVEALGGSLDVQGGEEIRFRLRLPEVPEALRSLVPPTS
jgi:TrmH family RNA methyltransferase